MEEFEFRVYVETVRDASRSICMAVPELEKLKILENDGVSKKFQPCETFELTLDNLDTLVNNINEYPQQIFAAIEYRVKRLLYEQISSRSIEIMVQESFFWLFSFLDNMGKRNITEEAMLIYELEYKDNINDLKTKVLRSYYENKQIERNLYKNLFE